MPSAIGEINPFCAEIGSGHLWPFRYIRRIVMKSGNNSILVLVLVVLVLAGVLFALQAIFRTREWRSLQAQMQVQQSNVTRVNLLFATAEEYSKTHPDLIPILKPFEPKTPAH